MTHCLKIIPTEQKMNQTATRPLLHPLLGTRMTSPLNKTVFLNQVSERHPFATYRFPDGVAILNSDALVALARVACAEVTGEEDVETALFQVSGTLVLNQVKALQIIATPDQQGRFEIEARAMVVGSNGSVNWESLVQGKTQLRQSEALPSV